jgi:hypothetical protein
MPPRTAIRLLLMLGVGAMSAAGVRAQGAATGIGDSSNPAAAFAPRGGGTLYCSTTPIDIPDADPGGITDAQVIVDSVPIADLNVTVNVTHSHVGDLVFTLQHSETGSTAVYIDRPGVPQTDSGCDGDDIDVEIDDEATLPVEDQCAAAVPAISGTFVGGDPPDAGLLSAFDGENIQGTWFMNVSDHAAGNLGMLNGWCLVIEPIPVDLVTISIE